MNNIIEGNPTKKFFIEMITRDISIEDAIIDLLDNSIDGANRINSENYNTLWINLTINDKEFIIQDNCGKSMPLGLVVQKKLLKPIMQLGDLVLE